MRTKEERELEILREENESLKRKNKYLIKANKTLRQAWEGLKSFKEKFFEIFEIEQSKINNDSTKI